MGEWELGTFRLPPEAALRYLREHTVKVKARIGLSQNWTISQRGMNGV